MAELGPEIFCLERAAHAKAYFHAKRYVLDRGFADEIEWQYNVSLSTLSVQDLLREAAWVILSAGMSERVVRSRFPFVSEAFYFWESPEKIKRHSEQCKAAALKSFGHTGKIHAIVSFASRVADTDFEELRLHAHDIGPSFFQSFDYIGPVTSFHLAKNIGVDVAKEDRHLMRLSESLGYSSASSFCRAVCAYALDPIRVIDVVLWRFATLCTNYCEIFRSWVEVSLSARELNCQNLGART